MSGLKESIEALLDLNDDVRRAFSDPLGEDGVYEYSVTLMKEEKGKADDDNKKDVLISSNCHACPLWENRRDDLFYFNPKKADVLSVVASSERSGCILLPDAEEMYENQMKALNIPRSRRALVSLLKCPSSELKKENADKCRPFLKADMVSFSPSVMILFGMDLAHYILGNNRSYEEIRASKRSFKVNGIRTFVTYSQRECIDNPSYKRVVWEDLKIIGKALS